MDQVQLLVIGAGPYALSVAALARERGIGTVVLGRPMGFWRENMPGGMFLRSGPDWHLDGAGVHTLQAYLQERGIGPGEADPVPVGVFLDYAAWFQRAKGIQVREEFAGTVVRAGGGFEATLRGGERIRADAVVAAPGIRPYASVPGWAAPTNYTVALVAGILAGLAVLFGLLALAFFYLWKKHPELWSKDNNSVKLRNSKVPLP